MKKSSFVVGVSALFAALVSSGADLPCAKVGERVVESYPVTISAGPINKIFDGRQRDRAQTKTAAVLSFDYANPFELVIDYPGGAPKDLEIRPSGRANAFRVADGKAVVGLLKPEQFVLFSPSGAAPDLHVFANAPFVAPEGPNVRRFAKGEHRPGLLSPKSNETIVLDEGAVVHAEMFVLNATNVTICGRGVLDFSEWGRADPRAKAFRKANGLVEEDTEFACNPFVIHGSQDVRVEGVTLKDAPFWTLIVRNGSRAVSIDNVKIVGNWRYNSDGINVCASERVTVRNCFIRSFDDCLVARAPYFAGDDGIPVRHLRFENNRLWCDWGKNCEIWAGHKDALMEDIVFRNNAFLNVHFTGCDVTTWFCSARTYIGDVVFEDNEYDLGQPRWKTVFQTSDGQKFNLERETEANLLSVDAWAPAKNLGNQHFGPADEISKYHLEYDGIRFSRPRVFGTDWSTTLTVKSETTTPYQHIRNVVCEDLPEGVKVTTKGNVELKDVTTRAGRLAKLWRSGDRRYVFVATHRMDWRHHPENSLSALEGVLAAGADILEFDVKRTKDGAYVISHDARVDRCTDGHGLISELTLAEIRALRLKEGQGGPAAPLTNERMPTLAEMLRAAKGRALVNLDQTDWIGLREIIDIVVENGSLDETIFKGGLDPKMLKLVCGPYYWDLFRAGTLRYMPVCKPVNEAAFSPRVVWQANDVKPGEYEYVLGTREQGVALDPAPFKGPDAPRLWVNTMWESLSGGHNDDDAIFDPEGTWGWVLDHGATAIQTDRPARLVKWLEGISRR